MKTRLKLNLSILVMLIAFVGSAYAANYTAWGVGNTIADARYNAYLQETTLNRLYGPCRRTGEYLVDNTKNPFYMPGTPKYTAYFYDSCAR